MRSTLIKANKWKEQTRGINTLLPAELVGSTNHGLEKWSSRSWGLRLVLFLVCSREGLTTEQRFFPGKVMRERERNVLLKRAIGFFDSDAFFASLGLLFLSPFILGNFCNLRFYPRDLRPNDAWSSDLFPVLERVVSSFVYLWSYYYARVDYILDFI